MVSLLHGPGAPSQRHGLRVVSGRLLRSVARRPIGRRSVRTSPRSRKITRLVIYGTCLGVLFFYMVSARGVSWDQFQAALGFLTSGTLWEPLLDVNIWEVAESARYESETAPPGAKFVMVTFEASCKRPFAFPVTAECFILLDQRGNQHRALASSPLFGERPEGFRIEVGETFDGSLLFQLPAEARAHTLQFASPRRTQRASGPPLEPLPRSEELPRGHKD